jgi:hypothetical protein
MRPSVHRFHARKVLDRLAERAGWKRGEIRTRLFRHTYCAARLQTLGAGAPVSIYTVARELDHQSHEMVKRIYAHLGVTPHRSDVMEYQVPQHLEQLGDPLRRLGFVTGNLWRGGRAGNGNPRSDRSRSGGTSSGVGPARLERATSCSGGASPR